MTQGINAVFLFNYGYSPDRLAPLATEADLARIDGSDHLSYFAKIKLCAYPGTSALCGALARGSLRQDSRWLYYVGQRDL